MTKLGEAPKFHPAQTAIIDLSGLTRGDCAGLSLLVDWLAVAESSGGELRYTGLPEKFERLARVAGLDFLFSEPKELNKASLIHHPDGVSSDSVL